MAILLALLPGAAKPLSSIRGTGIDPAVAQSTHAVAGPVGTTASATVLSNDEWMNNLRSESYWRKRRSEQGSSGSGGGSWGAPSGLFGTAPPPTPRPTTEGGVRFSGSYRTVCVRLCDGYFFPISYGVGRDRFEDDEATCERSCGSPAKLYVYRVPDEEPEDMVDVKGRPYSRLQTAFLYRTTYSAQCTCKPHPWQQEAQAKHRRYALQDAARKGNRSAAAELRSLARGAAKPPKGPKVARIETGTTTTDAAPSVFGLPAVAPVPTPTVSALQAASPVGPDSETPPPVKANRGALAEGQRPMRLGATTTVTRPNKAPPPAPARSDVGWQRKVFAGEGLN